MTDQEAEVRGILRGWLARHVVLEQEERTKYERGPSIHAARAKAHSRAALALHRALEVDADVRKA